MLILLQLHRSEYDKNLAVAEFVKSVPLVKSIDRRWDEEDSVSISVFLRSVNDFLFACYYLGNGDVVTLTQQSC